MPPPGWYDEEGIYGWDAWKDEASSWNVACAAFRPERGGAPKEEAMTGDPLGGEAAAEQLRVLDHGYVRLVETMGSDARIVEAARMSTGKGFLGWERTHSERCRNQGPGFEECIKDPDCLPGDAEFLSFLWKNRHTSPFEQCEATFEVKAPIFVFREWHRHRTQSYNEMSARYTPLPDENYVPSVDRIVSAMVNADKKKKKNKQETGVISNPVYDCEELRAMVASWLKMLKSAYGIAEHSYQAGLQGGIPKELARLCVPVGRYSRMRAKANLLNWLRFLGLRTAPNAQWEIRQYALAVKTLLTERFPRTLALFEESPL